MIVTLSSTHRPATDLGYLLHKHPERVQQFPQSFGVATVFYPEATAERCTAALLLEVDPVRLARSRMRDSPDFSLTQYVNDRSYAASSLLGVALADVFSTARSGRCVSRQELADSAIPLEIGIPVLPCRGGPEIAHRVFAPLGWQVDARPLELDDRFPEWGESRYVDLRLTGTVRLADALGQLHVLLPVLDESKHYWQGPDEVDKLLRSGGGWLATHPDKELITRRYLGRRGALTRLALARLAELGDETEDVVQPAEDEELLQPEQSRVPLSTQRHDAVLKALVELEARTVIDLGCGQGQFLDRLRKTASLRRIVGVDVSTRALQAAERRLGVDRMSEREASRVELFTGALTYEDTRLAGFDAAVLMEVIEHVDPPRLAALEWVVFESASPGAVIVTTPNAEYNHNFAALAGMRHPDHRFEWTRAQFAAWSDCVGDRYGYSVSRHGVGEADDTAGSPTQMAVFTRAS